MTTFVHIERLVLDLPLSAIEAARLERAVASELALLLGQAAADATPRHAWGREIAQALFHAIRT